MSEDTQELLAKVAEQAREIERLKEGQEKLIFVRDDYKKQAHEYRARWASGISSGNAPVGAIEAIRAEFPLFEGAGLDQETHHCEWSVQHDRKRLHALLARLNQPASAQQPVWWQFFQDGEWHMGLKRPASHRANTEAAGYPVRDLYAGPVMQPASGGDERAALRYTSDGALAECPCCGSLDVGGAHDTVNCYGCGLQITKPRPLQNAADAWNKRAALTCRPDHSEDVLDMVAAWIPVSERLPEPATDVLAYGVNHRSHSYVVAGVFSGTWASQETEEATRFEPTHWMPLPAAPAPSKQGGV